MDETKQTAETGSEEGGDQRQQQIVDMGSSTIRTERGTIHTLTIVGQIEGHQVLPSSAKTTKYEHVMPLLAAIEESDEVDGLLVLLNTVGGDIEAGLGLAERLLHLPRLRHPDADVHQQPLLARLFFQHIPAGRTGDQGNPDGAVRRLAGTQPAPGTAGAP